MGRYIPDEVPGHFWAIIDSCSSDRDSLRKQLADLPKEQVLRFCWNYQEAVGQIATLYHELTHFSEDTDEDICSWVVAQGEDAFVKVWDDAEDEITNPKSPYGQIQADPGLLGTALEVYKQRFGEEVPRKTHDRFIE